MSQHQSASSGTNLEMVLVDQPEVTPPAEPLPSSAPTLNLIDELCKKYGFSRPEPPVMVIAKPIPPSASAPVPPPVSFSESTVKTLAKKKVASSPSASSDSEEESIAAPEDIEIERVPL